MDLGAVAKVKLFSAVRRLLHGRTEEEAGFRFVSGRAWIDDLLSPSRHDLEIPLAKTEKEATGLIERSRSLVERGWQQKEARDRIFGVPGYQCRARLTGRYTGADDKSGKDTRNVIMVIYSGPLKLNYEAERYLLGESLAMTKAFMKNNCKDDLGLDFIHEDEMPADLKDAGDVFIEFLPRNQGPTW